MILHAMRDERVILCDVGPRDGLQNDAAVLEPAVRAELCRRLAATGLPRVEAASFVHPEARAADGGAPRTSSRTSTDRGGGTTFAALVLNRKGLERAVAAGAGEIHASYPLTDTFAERNQNTTVEAAAETTAAIIAEAHAAGLRATVTLGVAFGCPFEGEVDPGVVVEHAGRAAAAGADEIMLADTIGVAVPGQVSRLVPDARRAAGSVPSACTCTTRATPATRTRPPGSSTASRCSTRRSAASAAVRSRRVRPATSPPRTCSTCSTARASTPASTLTGVIAVAEWLGGVLGRDLPGLVHRAGPFPS